MDAKKVKLVKSEVKNNLNTMDIPEGIAKSCTKSREKFKNVLAGKMCLSVSESTFEGFKQAVNEFYD